MVKKGVKGFVIGCVKDVVIASVTGVDRMCVVGVWW